MAKRRVPIEEDGVEGALEELWLAALHIDLGARGGHDMWAAAARRIKDFPLEIAERTIIDRDRFLLRLLDLEGDDLLREIAWGRWRQSIERDPAKLGAISYRIMAWDGLIPPLPELENER